MASAKTIKPSHGVNEVIKLMVSNGFLDALNHPILWRHLFKTKCINLQYFSLQAKVKSAK